MKNGRKTLIILTLLIANVFAGSMIHVNAEKDNMQTLNIEEGKEGVFVATKTATALGAADGIKDDAYNSTHPIPISTFTHVNNNESSATANMYLLWDSSYLYMYAEIKDDNYYGYNSEEYLENNDAFELMVDLYHETDYWFDGYGGEYRNEWYGSGAKMCEGMYKIAAGVENATVGTTIQGTFYMWDANKDNGSYYSKTTEDGYTVEYKIAIGQDASTYLKKDREIGIGVKIYDRFDDTNSVSITTIENKNDNQTLTPKSLSHVVLSEGEATPTQRDIVNLEGRDNYIARKTDNYIIADGIKDLAWNDAKAIDLVYVRQFANENIGRMTIYMLWDDDYFYLFAEINDNTVNPCPTSDSFNYFNYDTVGFCLDLLRDTTVPNFDTGDYKTSVGFGGQYRGEPGPMCEGFWAVSRGANDLTIGTHWMCDDSNTRAQSSFASVSNENGYTVEMKIYAGNDKERFMQEDRKIGVGLNVSDQFAENEKGPGTVSQGVLDNKNFPNNDRAFGKVWAQGPSALSEVTLVGYESNESFESDGVERNSYQASRVLSDTKINIDGEMDEVYNTTKEVEIKTLVTGQTNATAKVRIMWTKGYIYLFVDVFDSNLGVSSIPSASDGVIVAIDLSPTNNERTSMWGSNETKNSEGIFVANVGKSVFGYGMGELYNRYLSRVASDIKSDGTGYTVEMRIEIGENVNVENNKIGLGIAIQDNIDGTGSKIDGIVAMNTQQDRMFKYKGVLDSVSLIANANETKANINDADSIDYIPSVENENNDNKENNNSNTNNNTENKEKEPIKDTRNNNLLSTILIIASSVVALSLVVILIIKKRGHKEVE